MLKSHRKPLSMESILILITCSTQSSLFHEDTLKYAETRRVYTAPCELQEGRRLLPWIQTAVTPQCL